MYIFDIIMSIKKKLILQVIEKLEADRAALVRAASEAHDGATNSEVKQEGKYDTRGIEAGYLAHGQSIRASEIKQSILGLRELLKVVDDSEDSATVGVGSIIEFEKNGVAENYFILPNTGGIKITLGKTTYTCISIHSPLAQKIIAEN